MAKPGSNVSPSPGIPVKTPKPVPDGRHTYGGASGNNHTTLEDFPNVFGRGGNKNPAGIGHPPTTDGHSAGQDGVVEGKVNVPRSRIMGQQDPVDGKR